jgi:hypothetical protein
MAAPGLLDDVCLSSSVVSAAVVLAVVVVVVVVAVVTADISGQYSTPGSRNRSENPQIRNGYSSDTHVLFSTIANESVLPAAV